MRRGPRGGPGALEPRLARAEVLLAGAGPATRGPLTVLVAVLRHQQSRIGGATGEPSVAVVTDEVERAIDALTDAVPLPLGEAGAHLRALAPSELAAIIETWLDDVALVEARLGFWLQVAAGPELETAAGHAEAVPGGWNGAACPVCGGQAQASVIAEESGEFMAGSPRSLVCGRCATWWSFPRVTCVTCGEHDPRRIESYFVEDDRSARVDLCATCRGYVKTFDLRQPGAADVIPLVDDVATLALDVWARDQGHSRAALSLAGV